MNGKNSFLQKLKEKSNIQRAYNLGKPSAYKVNDLEYIYLRYSKKYMHGDQTEYWYGVQKKFLMKLVDVDGFVVFIAENPCNNFKIPSKYILGLLKNVPTAKDGNWKLHIFETRTNFEFRLLKETIDLSDYLNLYQIDNKNIQFHQKQGIKKETHTNTNKKSYDLDFENSNIQDQIKILRRNQLIIMNKLGL